MHGEPSCAGLTRASRSGGQGGASLIGMAGTSPAMTCAATIRVIAALAVLAFATAAQAQTYGFATLPPGTLNHTTASAVSKVLKEKAGLNVLVQPTAGDNIIVPMVGRGEVEIGITNIMEAQDGFDRGIAGFRIDVAHALIKDRELRDNRPFAAGDPAWVERVGSWRDR